jgi:hypothetical protein
VKLIVLCSFLRNFACIAAKVEMDSTEKVMGVIDNDATSSYRARQPRSAESASHRRVPQCSSSTSAYPPHQQSCRIPRARSRARRLKYLILQHPMRPPRRALLFDELQARGRHQEAERHHFFGQHHFFGHPAQDERRAEDQLHGHFHPGEMFPRPPTQFEPSASEPMQQEHQGTTGDGADGYRERRREIYCET